MKKEKQIVPIEHIAQKIYLLRGQKVMLDVDLAYLYGVPTKVLNQSVKRNRARFPKDFMFQLDEKELKNLEKHITTQGNQERKWSQIVTTSQKYRGVMYLPYAFTEHGVAMLSSVLNSPRAIEMNIYVIRAFIKMRELIAIDRDLELGIFLLRTEQKEQAKEIEEIIERLNELTDEPLKTPGPLGFRP
jgi:hypothetical protein